MRFLRKANTKHHMGPGTARFYPHENRQVERSYPHCRDEKTEALALGHVHEGPVSNQA